MHKKRLCLFFPSLLQLQPACCCACCNATRGRVMVEIVSQPGGDKLEKKMNKIDVNDVKRIEPFQVCAVCLSLYICVCTSVSVHLHVCVCLPDCMCVRVCVCLSYLSVSAGMHVHVRVFVCTRNTPRIADAFQSRKAYFLRIELLDLNMLSEKVRDGFVRVEASIGNIGNVKEQPVSAVCFVCCVCALYVVCVCVCVYVLCMLCVCVCACLFVSLPPPLCLSQTHGPRTCSHPPMRSPLTANCRRRKGASPRPQSRLLMARAIITSPGRTGSPASS